jgi:dsRNA-specific ribonuclease
MNKNKLPKNLNDLAAILDYSFKNQGLMSQAFRHPSYVYEMDGFSAMRLLTLLLAICLWNPFLK